MALRIRFQYFSGAQLGYSIERLSDGLILDQSDMTFKSIPINAIGQLTEGSNPYSGIYRITISNTPVAQFSNGNYAISIHRIDMNNSVLGLLRTTMINGDDNNVITSGGGSTSVDINAVAKGVWDYSVSNAITASSVGKLLKDNLDVSVSSRSTFAGGPVQSVTNPVTVGTNQDKSGYVMAASGLDSIIIEQGINLRQAIAPILAATAGVISGAGTGQIVIRGGNTSVSRILASTDNQGNRTSVTLVLPS